MGKLDGRVAIVTGAGRGIGAAVAETFAREGCSVVVNDLGAAMDGDGQDDKSAAQAVADRINEAGGKATANTESVTDFKAAERMIQQAVDEFGKLDILVNVAGIIRDGLIFKMGEEQWDSVIDVHLKGTFNTTRHASVYWRAHRGGEYRLINFVSGSGLFGSPVQPNYAAAKMGIVGLTFSCANALHNYGVTSNCIAPIAFTRMTASLQGRGTTLDYSPDNPKLSPDNVTPPVVYLAMEESGWLNGRVIEAGNAKIGLFSNFAMNRQIGTEGVWDLDTAIEEMKGAFQPALGNPNPFAPKPTD